MDPKKEMGRKGEEIAREILVRKGFQIIHSNWTCNKLEIDIIAQKEDELVFVEVKSRGSSEYGEPERFVTPAKQKNLIRAANLYFEQSGSMLPARFDVVSVLFMRGEVFAEHIEEAFWPIA
jgi:putative endonuclease